jgi:hypothetical protein
MSLINFTIQHDQLAAVDDTSDEGADVDLIPLIGEVTFTPIFDNYRPLLAPDYAPRPTAFTIMPFVGYIGMDGRLRSTRNGSLGVRLIANDPVLQLSSLKYRVSFRLTTPIGEPVRVDGGYFAAPYDDRVINLVDVLQSNSSLGGPRIVAGEFDGDTVIFENSDGTLLAAITIPEGVLVFTDNGDSTWSVG